MPHPVVLGLAADAPGGLRARLKTPFRHAVPAINAGTVAAVVQAGKRVKDLPALLPGRFEHRLAAVGLGKVGACVRGIPRIADGSIVCVILPLQDRNGPVQAVANLLKTLARCGRIHGFLPPVRMAGLRRDALPGRYGIQNKVAPEPAAAPSGGWAPDGPGWGAGDSDEPAPVPGPATGSLSSGPLFRTLFTAVETG